MLFLDVVDAAPKHTDPGQIQALAKRLGIVVRCGRGEIGLQSRRDSYGKIPESTKYGLWSEYEESSAVLEFTNFTTGQRRMTSSWFLWRRMNILWKLGRGLNPHGAQSPVEGVMQVLNAKEQQCQCSLCKLAFSNEQIAATTKYDESSVELYSIEENEHYEPGERSLTVYIAFHADQYLSTTMTIKKDSSSDPRVTPVFRAPYHPLWKLKKPGAEMQIPSISVLLLLAHPELGLSAERRQPR